MTDNFSGKINISSLQVLKTLQILMQGKYTMPEIIDKLNEKESSPIFNHSVVSKYINTCKYCNIKIPKINNKYIVTYIPFGLEVNSSDIRLLEILQQSAKAYMSQKVCTIFNKLLEKINLYSNKQIAKINKDTYEFTVEIFKRAVSDRRKIKLTLKNGKEIICIPICVAEDQGKSFFNVLHNDKESVIPLTRISAVEAVNEKFLKSFSDQTVIFHLKGDLAHRYSPRENENVELSVSGDYLIVSNRGENKEILLSRLMRYDDKCEIISPKSYIEEIKQIIDDTLKNYGEL